MGYLPLIADGRVVDYADGSQLKEEQIEGDLIRSSFVETFRMEAFLTVQRD